MPLHGDDDAGPAQFQTFDNAVGRGGRDDESFPDALGLAVPPSSPAEPGSASRTTLLYVQLAPQDVWREYARALANRTRPSTPPIP